MEVQLAECYRPLVTDRTLAVELPPTQIQCSGVDCGLFAIAITYDLASDNDPSQISYDQRKMREHLVLCLDNDLFQQFPRQINTARLNKRENCDIYLFCSCMILECWDNMIQCNPWDEWLHMSCQGPWFLQLQTNQIQGLFKDFTTTKNSFQGVSFI